MDKNYLTVLLLIGERKRDQKKEGKNSFLIIRNGKKKEKTMIKKNADKLKRKQERETFVGFRPSVINHGKNYTRKQKHKKAWSDDQPFCVTLQNRKIL